jgi:hypothetical protein
VFSENLNLDFLIWTTKSGGISMKKWMFFMIACVSITLIGYSVIAYANNPAAGDSKEVKGSFVAVEGQSNIQIKTQSGTETIPLAKSVWVYRDQQKANLTDLKAEDQVELILNAKMQAAYVKATSPGFTPPSVMPSPSTTPSVTPSPTPATPTATPLPSPSDIPVVQTDVTQPSTQSTQAPQLQAGVKEELWNKLQIEALGEGLNLNLYVTQELKAKVKIYTDQQGTIYLDGQTAKVFIQNILAQAHQQNFSKNNKAVKQINNQRGYDKHGNHDDDDHKADQGDDRNKNDDNSKSEH